MQIYLSFFPIKAIYRICRVSVKSVSCVRHFWSLGQVPALLQVGLFNLFLITFLLFKIFFFWALGSVRFVKGRLEGVRLCNPSSSVLQNSAVQCCCWPPALGRGRSSQANGGARCTTWVSFLLSECWHDLGSHLVTIRIEDCYRQMHSWAYGRAEDTCMLGDGLRVLTDGCISNFGWPLLTELQA